MSLRDKFEEQTAIDNILDILEEMTAGSKFSQNMGHMVARNKQRTLQLKPYNYKVKKTGYENREQTMPAGQAQQSQAPTQQQAQQAAQQRAQGQVQQQVQHPNDPRVLRLAGKLLNFSKRGDMAEKQILQILNSALKKLGASE